MGLLAYSTGTMIVDCNFTRVYVATGGGIRLWGNISTTLFFVVIFWIFPVSLMETALRCLMPTVCQIVLSVSATGCHFENTIAEHDGGAVL